MLLLRRPRNPRGMYTTGRYETNGKNGNSQTVGVNECFCKTRRPKRCMATHDMISTDMMLVPLLLLGAITHTHLGTASQCVGVLYSVAEPMTLYNDKRYDVQI